MLKHSRSTIAHLSPALIADTVHIQAVARHVTQFPLNAMVKPSMIIRPANWGLLLLSVALNGCAWMPKQLEGIRTLVGLPPPETTVKLPAPSDWQAPLPHGGSISELKAWWQQFNDPLLLQLIDEAQVVSPSIATAKSRIEQSRAQKVSATAALLPDLNATGSISRGLVSLFFPPATISSIALQSNWELDLFGGNQAKQTAAEVRITEATATWHDARVSVAAEVANQYNTLRSCEAQLAFARTDAHSRRETARLTEEMSRAGLQAPANAALANASAAQANNTLMAQMALCKSAIKALVALTGEAEPSLKQRLLVTTGIVPQPQLIEVASVPGDVLKQRPDIIAAGQEILAVSGDVAELQARRYPKISFSGNIGLMNLDVSPASKGGTVWNIGPLSVTLPLFDGGVRAANVEAARARYTEASVNFAGKVRNAVREVEDALANLDSTSKRNAELAKAVAGYKEALTAKQELYKVGLVSLIELEESRRLYVQAQTGQIQLQHDHVSAWIALYRALGGGWMVADASLSETKKVLFD